MPSVTLADAAKLSQDELVQGVVESIVSVNPVYSIMPFDMFSGNALAYNVEATLGGADFVGRGGDNTVNVIGSALKTPTTTTQKTTALKPIIGDAEVDHFVMTTMGDVNNQQAFQIASKAKSIGRKFQDTMVNGDTGANALAFDGLVKLCATGQKVTTQQNMTLDLLDELISKVLAKDGQVDYFLMHDIHIRKYFNLLRALGGAGIGEVVTLPGGTQVPAYRGVPLFRNDFVTVNTVDTPDTAPILCGTFDDGSRKVGMAGLTSETNAGIFVTNIGEAEGNNNVITRVRFYAGLALFSELGLSMATKVNVA